MAPEPEKLTVTLAVTSLPPHNTEEETEFLQLEVEEVRGEVCTLLDEKRHSPRFRIICCIFLDMLLFIICSFSA